MLLLQCVFAATSGEADQLSLDAALKEGRYNDAYAIATSSAENGDAYAQYILGSMLASGQGAGRNMVDATMWLDKSARQGSADALGMLALLHYTGEAPNSRLWKAWKYASLAAKLGAPDAIFLEFRAFVELSEDEMLKGQEAIERWQKETGIKLPSSESAN